MTDVKRRPSSKTQTARTSAHARAPTSTGVHQRTMKLSTEIFRLTQQMALRDPRWTKAAPGAMSDEVRGDPNSTETCCEEFLYPVKEPGRRRSTEPSGADPLIHSVAGPGPAPAFSLRRPRSSPMEIRHRRWRVGIAASTDCWLSHPIFVADRPASTEPRSCVSTCVPDDPGGIQAGRWAPGQLHCGTSDAVTPQPSRAASLAFGLP